MKKTRFYGYIYDFSGNYNTIAVDDILDMSRTNETHYISQINLSAKVYVMMDLSGILVHECECGK